MADESANSAEDAPTSVTVTNFGSGTLGGGLGILESGQPLSSKATKTSKVRGASFFIMNLQTQIVLRWANHRSAAGGAPAQADNSRHRPTRTGAALQRFAFGPTVMG